VNQNFPDYGEPDFVMSFIPKILQDSGNIFSALALNNSLEPFRNPLNFQFPHFFSVTISGQMVWWSL
jgi:hypothetical protein